MRPIAPSASSPSAWQSLSDAPAPEPAFLADVV